MWQDSALLFSARESGKISPHFGAISSLNHKVNLEKSEKKSTGENSKRSSGDGAPKLQISVPFRGRTRPDQYRREVLIFLILHPSACGSL